MIKEKKKLSPEDQEAKMSFLKDVMKDMDAMMCNDLDDKKKMKVSVISDSKEGVAKGLDKAEDILSGEPSLVTPKFGSEQEPGALMNEEDYASDSELEPSDEELSSDELDQKIKKLLALKEQKSVKAPF